MRASFLSRIRPVVLSAIVALPALTAGRAGAQSFELKYPSVISISLNNQKVSELKVSYPNLRDPQKGWPLLSNALYGTPDYGNDLKKMNNSAESPMKATSFLQGFYCEYISDKYCGARVIIRDPNKKVEEPKPAPAVSASASAKPSLTHNGYVKPKPSASAASSSAAPAASAPPADTEDE